MALDPASGYTEEQIEVMNPERPGFFGGIKNYVTGSFLGSDGKLGVDDVLLAPFGPIVGPIRGLNKVAKEKAQGDEREEIATELAEIRARRAAEGKEENLAAEIQEMRDSHSSFGEKAKDFVAGFFLGADGQFGMGEVVKIGVVGAAVAFTGGAALPILAGVAAWCAVDGVRNMGDREEAREDVANGLLELEKKEKLAFATDGVRENSAKIAQQQARIEALEAVVGGAQMMGDANMNTVEAAPPVVLAQEQSRLDVPTRH